MYEMDLNTDICKKVENGKVWAIVPARSGSKGIIDKNIKLFQGYPLIAYTIAAGALAENIDRVIVSTDSQQYADIAKIFGAEVPFLRPAKYATDDSQDIDFMKHAISWFYDNEEVLPEYWVHLRVTCPIRKAETVDEAISRIKEHQEASSLLSVCIPEGVLTPFKWLVKDGEYLRSIFFENNDDSNKPRQSYPDAYCRSIYVDIYKTDTIVRQGVLFGDCIVPFETSETVDIDELSDLLKAEKLVIDSEITEYLRNMEHAQNDKGFI